MQTRPNINEHQGFKKRREVKYGAFSKQCMRIRSVAIDSCLGVIASYTFHGLSCQDKLCHTSSQLVLLCHKESYSVTRSRATLVTGLPFGSFATKERRLSLSSPSPSLARFTIFFAYGDLSDLSHFDHL